VKTLTVKTSAQWRRWLAKNHATRDEVWLVYFKKHTGRPTIDYGDSVDEALCYGWIDSILRRIDDDRYARKFTPRKDDSNWSPSNKKRVERLVAAGRMTRAGLRKVEYARKHGLWDAPDRPDIPTAVPDELARALKRNRKAAAFFEGLAPGYRRRFIAWVATAKRPETRDRRVRKSIELLARGEKLGMV
jgi:uncharacterized protein YdeI (YjbR/CyaY-like superfamily)